MLAGVDGCPGGRWAIAISDNSLGTIDAEVTDNIGTIVERFRDGEFEAVAIDMPIGLLDDRTRRSDKECRALLGPRRASVFPTPVRGVLGAKDYPDACVRSREAFGKALSKQAFNLLPRIAELDQLVRPEDQNRLVEAHPELAFTRLHGDHVPWSKQTPDGRRLRTELLAAVFSDAGVEAVLRSGLAPAVDLLDAAALLTTAHRVFGGTEIRLGTEIDATGKRAEVVY